MKILFNALARRKLLLYASEEGGSGHWGGAEIEIPEHSILIRKIKEEQGTELELSERQLMTIMDWFNTATNEGTSIDADDVALLKNIRSAIAEHLGKRLESYEREIKPFLARLQEIDQLLPSQAIGLEHHPYPIQETERIASTLIEPQGPVQEGKPLLKGSASSESKVVPRKTLDEEFEKKSEAVRKLAELKAKSKSNLSGAEKKKADEFIKKIEKMSGRLKI